MATLVPQVLAALPDGRTQVVVDDLKSNGAWYARSLVLELERRGVDVAVRPEREPLFGSHRVADPDRPEVWLILTIDDAIDEADAVPTWRRIAHWSALPDGARRPLVATREELLDRIAADPTRRDFDRLDAVEAELRDHRASSRAFEAAVYIYEGSRVPTSP
jgi:hypothetical protein